MAASSLLALLDDIATVLDDVSVMTKVAARKTAGVLGDDLALNAQQVAGVRAEREIPVVWKVALGSLKNKAILVPGALLISVVAAWAITPLLMLGGAFLCYEGAEKLVHKFAHRGAATRAHAALSDALARPEVDMVEFERDKIRGAIRTDFILSAEIIVITLGTVADRPLSIQIPVLIGIAVLMTLGVYGLVAAIVKLDDAGLWLTRQPGQDVWAAIKRRIGALILRIAPWFMKTLSVVGTIAMFLVGGGILVHGIPLLAQWLHGVEHSVEGLPAVGHVLAGATPMLLNGLFGVFAGGLVVALVAAATRVVGR